MSEKFEVPSPSAEAWHRMEMRLGMKFPAGALFSAYKEDFPAAVRAEVERFGEILALNVGVHGHRVREWTQETVAAYLLARFGETAPESQPESPADRVLASLAKAYPYLVKHADHIDGEFSSALAEVRRMLKPVPTPAGERRYRCANCGGVMNAVQYEENRLRGTHTDAHGKEGVPNNQIGFCPNPECLDFTLVEVTDCTIPHAAGEDGRCYRCGVPTPSAPAETLTAVSLVACRCGYAMQAAGRCPRCNTYVDRKGPHPEFDGGLTPAGRDFLRALCEERVAAANIPATMAYYPDLQQKLGEASEAVVTAARRVVEEDK